MKSQLAIGIDVGGTNIKGVLINKNGEVLKKVTKETDKKSILWRDTTLRVLHELEGGKLDNLPIGLSAPGLANETQDAIACMPGRLDGLEDLKWADFFKVDKVNVLNDAHAALMAEYTFGVAKGTANFVMLTLGTGVGGAIMINGSIYKGFNGIAGHFGHMSLDANSSKSGITNMPGSLEDAVGESTIFLRSGGKFETVKEMVDAYNNGDHLAEQLWMKSVKELAIGICSICNILSPEKVIIGGGVANAKESLFEPLDTFMDMYEWRPNGTKTIIKRAKFHEYAGAIGAAAFAFQNN